MLRCHLSFDAMVTSTFNAVVPSETRKGFTLRYHVGVGQTFTRRKHTRVTSSLEAMLLYGVQTKTKDIFSI
jgi:hypothetical protein